VFVCHMILTQNFFTSYCTSIILKCHSSNTYRDQTDKHLLHYKQHLLVCTALSKGICPFSFAIKSVLLQCPLYGNLTCNYWKIWIIYLLLIK